MSSPGGDDLFILTNSEELVKDVFELFFKVQSPRSAWRRPRQDETPAASGPCPDSSFSVLLCKEIVKDFFQILDAGRWSPKAPFIGELAAKGGLRG